PAPSPPGRVPRMDGQLVAMAGVPAQALTHPPFAFHREASAVRSAVHEALRSVLAAAGSAPEACQSPPAWGHRIRKGEARIIRTPKRRPGKRRWIACEANTTWALGCPSGVVRRKISAQGRYQRLVQNYKRVTSGENLAGGCRFPPGRASLSRKQTI